MKNIQIYSILLLFFVGVQELVAQCPPPQGEALQSFCGAALRAQINEPPANLTDLVVVGDNLQWYSDAGGTTPIPNTTLLVDGQTYYVSQTTTGTQGCESILLAVQAVEKYCNCVPNGGFERDATTSTASGYSFAYYDFPVNPPGMQQCQTDLNSIPLQNLTSLDPVNGYNNPTNFLNSRAYILTPGPDSFMSGSSTTQIRVEPNTPYNQRAMGFNDLVAIGNLIVMSKEIIAGQSFSFDYALGMEDATNTNLPPIELPFFKVQIWDQNNNLVSEQCIAFERNSCRFIEAPGGLGLNYTLWTCMELDTSSIAGQAATVVFAMSDYQQPGSFYGYAYIDNLGNASCSNDVFGKVSIDEPTGTAGSSACSLLAPVNQDPCLAPVAVQSGP
ncbi:hypothetical protein, partial [uncultured Mesonia sp.]|uniref:hypothetical protein n=1 Tax=uncultured Mesonia sp. TaxID=399731 RepID=UPI00374E6656